MKAGWKGTEACWEVEPSLMIWIQAKKGARIILVIVLHKRYQFIIPCAILWLITDL